MNEDSVLQDYLNIKAVENMEGHIAWVAIWSRYLRAFYQGLVDAGFSSEQAMELVKAQMSIIRGQTEAQDGNHT